MIRVGIDARPLAHPSTGIGQYTKHLVDQLQRSEKVSLYLYSRDLLPSTAHNTRVRHGPSGMIPNALHAQLYFSRWAKKDRLDVFWSPRHHLPLNLHCPSVVTIHDMVWLKQPHTMTRGGATLESHLMPRAIIKAQHIICVSNATRRDLIDFAPQAAKKSSVIYAAACQHPQNKLSHRSSTPFFLFVGTKEPRKNLDRCLQAWRDSNLAREGFNFVLAGNTGWKYPLHERIIQLGLESSVIDLQPTNEELNTLYATCHAVVLPSLYEGFGLPLAEGMAFGKPLITSNVSSMPEIAGDAAILVDPKNVQEISAALRSLATDQGLHAALSEKSTARGQRFSWATAGAQTMKVLLQVASTG